MDTFFQKHRKGITLAFNLLFWLIACFFFVRFSMLRPMSKTHFYKEFVCFGLIVAVVLTTQQFTIPRLFQHGRYTLFWAVSICLLLLATVFETLLVKTDLIEKVYLQKNTIVYLPLTFIFVFFRDSCFFAWFLVFRLYTLQKDSFRAKQRASVLEHQSVQFSAPDQKEISIPVDIIVYIQEVDHATQVHCTTDEVITVTEPFSRCKEIIPDTLWTLEGFDKMVFHQHLSEYVQTQNKPDIREIKTITLLNDRQYRIFEIIRQNPGCNATFLYESFHRKVTRRTIERDIAALRSKEVIAHVGSNKEGGYEICHCNVVLMD